MAYSIEAALQSGIFDRVIVSTDSKEYGEIGMKYGAEVMYRGDELSNDNASTFMVLENLLGRLEKRPDYFVLLQPTSPMRDASHIREAVELFEKKQNEFDFLVSVKEAEHAKVLVNPIEEDGSLKHFDTDFSNYKRQSFKDYSPNGAIFIGKPQSYLERKHFFGARTVAYMMNEFDSVDIDNELDYELAKICMTRRLAGK